MPPNPIDDAAFFVRQNYLDFLNREPDPKGQYWTDRITSCGTDDARVRAERVFVAVEFLRCVEFQQAAMPAYLANLAAYGARPLFSVFLRETQALAKGVVVLEAGSEQVLERNKQAYFAEFVVRPEFDAGYPRTMTPAQFVGSLLAETRAEASERQQAIAEFGQSLTTNDPAARARVMRRVAEDAVFAAQQQSRALVHMLHFGCLRRDAEAAVEQSWLEKLSGGDPAAAISTMVSAVIESAEYRRRFAPASARGTKIDR